MSYILDALRRSQAERERGRVPGLDAQPLPADRAGGPRRAVPIAWVGSGVGVALLLVGVLVATWWVRPQPRAPQVTPAPPASPAAPGATALEAPRAPRPAAEPARAPAAPSALPQVVSVPPAPPPTRSAPAPSAEPARPQSAPPTTPAQAQARLPPAPAPRALPLAQLTAEQRRELPALVIGGSIWSDNAANRFVIVNGQVVREGDAAAAGVTLERIGPKSVTLRWRELLLEMPL